MASVSSLTNSSSSMSSIYGNRNIISGLASGMDTEALIENCIKGYQTKIAKLQQQQTKVTWKQDAYRSITDTLLSISQKYTSYTSKTNLSSPSFFLNSVNTTTNGINASKVSATGRTNSEIKINAVKQLASAARYSTDATVLETKNSAVGTAVNFDERVQLTKLSGDITLTVGGNKVSLSFDDDEIIKNAGELTDAINKKLAEQDLGNSKANTKVKAVNEGGTIRFQTIGDAKAAGDAVWISAAYGDIKDTLGINAGALGKGDTTLKVNGKEIYQQVDRKEYLSNKTIDIKMDGKTARVVLGDLTKQDDPATVIKDAMQKQADAVFGKGKLKVEVNEKDGSFSFTTDEKDKDGNIAKVEVSSTAGAALGFGTKGLSNSLSTSATLKQAFGSEFDSLCNDIRVSAGDVRPGADAETGVDKSGNPVKKVNGVWYRLKTLEQPDSDNPNAKVNAENVRVDKNAANGTVGKVKVDNTEKAVIKHTDGKWYYRKDDGTADTAAGAVAETDVRPGDDAVKGVDRNGRSVMKDSSSGEWYYLKIATADYDTGTVINENNVRPAADAATGIIRETTSVKKYTDESGNSKWYYERDWDTETNKPKTGATAVTANIEPDNNKGFDTVANKAVEKQNGKWYYLDTVTGKIDTNAPAGENNYIRPADDATTAKVQETSTVKKHTDGNWYYERDWDNEKNEPKADAKKVNANNVRAAADATTGLDAYGKVIQKNPTDSKWYYPGTDGLIDTRVSADDVRPNAEATTAVDKDGNVVYKNENGAWYRKDSKADLVINGEKIGSFDKNATIEDVLNAINNNDKAGVKASYSKLTNKFVLTASETGSEGKIEISGALGEALFGKTEVGRAEVNQNNSGIVTDSEGNDLALKDEDGNEYYLRVLYEDGKAITNRDGTVKYVKAIKATINGKEMYRTLSNSGGPIEASMKDESVLATLKQARKGYEDGKDAILSVTVNGDTKTLTRSSNVIDMDGMTVTLNDVFNYDKDANGVNFFDENNNLNKNAKLERDSIVTFTTKADADKIVEAVQEFIKEFNEITTKVRTEYSTTPMKNSKKRNYEPLTDEDREGMSETQIKEYEEKAKTGLLFGDSDLSRLHNSLRSAITTSGDLRKAMNEMGLTVKYEGGITTLSLDESKFRAALDKDINAVQKVFTASTENGDSYDGLMARTKKTIDTYASNSIGSFGILVRKAGTTTKSLSLRDNTLQKQYNNLEDQIERWQNKMSDKVDYYTRQFTKLEQLMNQMNSQSATLAGLTGGY